MNMSGENTENRRRAGSGRAAGGQAGSVTRYLVSAAMLSAVAVVLQYIEFSIPIMPSFIKMDLSDLPALIGSFSMGPLYGVIIALVKNLLHLLRTSTGGIGELSNFLLSALFVLPAGLIYQRNKTRKRAIIGAVVGAVCMAVFSVITNFFIVYPVYTAFMPMETIIAMYQAILPKIKDGDLLSCLVIFNMPFTFVKAMLSVAITLLIYKPLSPIIHGE